MDPRGFVLAISVMALTALLGKLFFIPFIVACVIMLIAQVRQLVRGRPTP